ncbi:MAG: peptidase carboxypeptidase [Acidobacteria bacterium]|nr:peptidase carboxypeptidase [Acidobacteriota bacterium]
MQPNKIRTLIAAFCSVFIVSIGAGFGSEVPATGTIATAASSQIPAPEDVLSFHPGDDRKLASWQKVLEYFQRLDAASDRVQFAELGKTTMGAPFVMATISAPENLARLDECRSIQEQLADPRKLGRNPDAKAAELIKRGKTIVLITCGIHSTEVGSYLSSMLIAHRLASSNDPEIKEILDNTIILLVPSLNPDGVDIVKKWYDKTLGTPYEGTDPPELYHKYTGHDDNRDWYAFTQVETQITVDKIHNVWHPQIVHDIHQQGEFGSRLFLPPYMKPVEPNVPKQIVEGYTELGNYMAREMRAAGFKGITTDSTYDAWSPSRAYSHYHGGVRILSETASCRLATPINVKFDQLRPGEGYDPRKVAANFGPVWQGGEWHIRDITNHMTSAALFLLKHAAQNREQWLQRFYEIGIEAVRNRRRGELTALLVLPSASEQRFTNLLGAKSSDHLLGILETGAVETEATRRFVLQGRVYPAGTEVISMNQPYSAFARALLQVQRYPDLRDALGKPIAPYDVTAHTLSLLMGVEVKPVFGPIHYAKLQTEPQGRNGGCGDGALRGVYRSHVPSMDEGWTRWVLDKQGCTNYVALEDREVRAGNLRQKFESIVIPDQLPASILTGYKSGTMPSEYVGGLGEKGVKALREFVEQGGTVVCLNRASDFAIDQFKLPLRDVVAGLPHTEFYVPGSILRLALDTSNPIAAGMSKESVAWAEDSPVFEVLSVTRALSGTGVSPVGVRDKHANIGETPMPQVHVIGWYPKDKDPLLSGWLLGGERIKGKAALVEVTLGEGSIILFGFRPQYRGQSIATYPLFFKAIR